MSLLNAFGCVVAFLDQKRSGCVMGLKVPSDTRCAGWHACNPEHTFVSGRQHSRKLWMRGGSKAVDRRLRVIRIKPLNRDQWRH